MVKKILSLGVLLWSLNVSAQKEPYIDPKLRPYVYDYMCDLLRNGIFPSKYSQIDSIVVTPYNRKICGDTVFTGCAEWNLNKDKSIHRRIYLQQYSKDAGTIDSLYYKYLIYHELGHALFNLEHDDKRLSLMNSYSDDNVYGTKEWNNLHYMYIVSIKKSELYKKS